MVTRNGPCPGGYGGRTEVGRRSTGGQTEVKRRSLSRVVCMRPQAAHDPSDIVLNSPDAGRTSVRLRDRQAGQSRSTSLRIAHPRCLTLVSMPIENRATGAKAATPAQFHPAATPGSLTGHRPRIYRRPLAEPACLHFNGKFPAGSSPHSSAAKRSSTSPKSAVDEDRELAFRGSTQGSPPAESRISP